MKSLLKLALKWLTSKEAIKIVFEFLLKQCGDDPNALNDFRTELVGGIATIDDKLAFLKGN